MIAKDLESIFADPFGSVTISIGSSTTTGFLDQMDELVPDGFGNNAQVRSTVLTIKKGSLVGIAQDMAITADGVNYKVRQQAFSDDGLLQHLKVA